MNLRDEAMATYLARQAEEEAKRPAMNKPSGTCARCQECPIRGAAECPVRQREIVIDRLRTALTFRKLQEEQRPWVAHNFAGRHPYYPLLGLMEELGELSHAHLKALQGIRTGEDHEAAKIDAVGDIVIFLSDYCSANDIDFQRAVEETWENVKKRDWKKDKAGGGEG